MAQAKLFRVGGSQAVRLPKDFRMPGDRVNIRREGHTVVLEPIPQPPARDRAAIRAWLAEIHALAGPDGFDRDQASAQERNWSAFD